MYADILDTRISSPFRCAMWRSREHLVKSISSFQRPLFWGTSIKIIFWVYQSGDRSGDLLITAHLPPIHNTLDHSCNTRIPTHLKATIHCWVKGRWVVPAVLTWAECALHRRGLPVLVVGVGTKKNKNKKWYYWLLEALSSISSLNWAWSTDLALKPAYWTRQVLSRHFQVAQINTASV